MDVAAAIEQRRSVKYFDPAHRITDAEVDRLMSLVLRSPTSFNMQNWRFLLVRDPELRRLLRAAAFDQSAVTDASLLVVLCADLKAWDRDPEGCWRNAPPEVRTRMVAMMRRAYSGDGQLQRDEAMRSCGIAAMALMLAALEMGYDTCPMVGFDFEKVGRLIDLPEDHVLVLFLAVGKRRADPRPHGGRLPPESLVLRDRF